MSSAARLGAFAVCSLTLGPVAMVGGVVAAVDGLPWWVTSLAWSLGTVLGTVGGRTLAVITRSAGREASISGD